ncbi:nuclease-related domain-containing protein [Streptomyces sp. NPDC005732]|uniref:nuclease-related domain-containing protein n=1 Tax=Streptomyces sp. NPDC005732 TaxID=3157057 RepID=UPI0033DE9A68
MTVTALVIAAAAVLYYTRGSRWLRTITDRIRGRSRSRGAGASAAARARQLRTPAVRVAEHLGIPTQRGREAARWAAGAEGERRTAARLTALERAGWTVLHDRALPRGRANVDHLLISPTGRVYLPDTKRWSARWPLTARSGRLFHGERDVTRRLDGLHHEAAAVSAALRAHVTPLAAMDGPPIPAGQLMVDGLLLVPADQLVAQLLRLDRTSHCPRLRPAPLAATAARLLPPYHQGHR